MQSHHAVHDSRKRTSTFDLSRSEVDALLDTACRLKRAAVAGKIELPLRGKNLAVLSDAPLGISEGRVQRAASALGAQVVNLQPRHLQKSDASDIDGTARLLGRLYDALDCEHIDPALVSRLEQAAGVPVFHGLGTDDHPTRLLGELLTMREQSGKPVADLCLCVPGQAQMPSIYTLLRIAVVVGIEVRIAGPKAERPSRERLQRLARASGARLRVVNTLAEASAGADFAIDPATESVIDLRAGGAALDPSARAKNHHYTLQAMLLNAMK